MSRWADTALAEWRRHPAPPPARREAQAVGAAVAGVMAQLGLASALDELAVRRAWSEIVGPFLAGLSEPERIRAGVLHVRVPQPSVRFELERVWKPEIARKLADRFGAGRIRDVRFVS